MDHIIKGSIDREHSSADALRGVLDAGFFEKSTLVIKSTDGSVTGSILISKGRAIKGARLDTSSDVGYKAVRKLLTLKQAYFVYDIGGDDSLKSESAVINADIVNILRFLPNLPDVAPAQFLSDQTIPPNPNSNFRAELQDFANQQSQESAAVSATNTADRTRGVERMRGREARWMVLRGPLIWGGLALICFGVWHFWGSDINTLIHSKNFPFGGGSHSTHRHK